MEEATSRQQQRLCSSRPVKFLGKTPASRSPAFPTLLWKATCVAEARGPMRQKDDDAGIDDGDDGFFFAT